jgi:hypothetical protein
MSSELLVGQGLGWLKVGVNVPLLSGGERPEEAAAAAPGVCQELASAAVVMMVESWHRYISLLWFSLSHGVPVVQTDMGFEPPQQGSGRLRPTAPRLTKMTNPAPVGTG